MIALYRKLRPRNFGQVIGQNHITKTLVNQLNLNRVSHAYLFCGTRGTGKTSTAKIFAKALNCENSSGGNPCGVCTSCKSFDDNISVNIIEIDAASNTSVENIRDLKEDVKYPPAEGKYKIYIIDEVHMLSLGAFNALLKTLEEPPSHVIFILATTDPHKIPVTILSRCQRFDFKRITASDIANTLKTYMEDENIHITDEALYYIAKICDGGMRDALSILDQTISFYYGEEITLHKVLEVVGSVDSSVFFDFTDKLINFDAVGILNIIDIITRNGRDISQFVIDIIGHFRNLMMVKSMNEVDLVNLNILEEKVEELKQQAHLVDTNYLLKLINEFANIQSLLKHSSDERIILEVNCIKLCSIYDMEDISDLKNKISILQKRLDEVDKNLLENNSKISNYPKNDVVNVENPQNTVQKEPKFRELAINDDIKKAINGYSEIIKKFEMPQKLFLEMCVPSSLEDNFLYLVTEKAYIGSLERNIDEIKHALEEKFDKKYELKILSKKAYKERYDKIASKPRNQEISNNNSDMEKIINSFPSDILNIK